MMFNGSVKQVKPLCALKNLPLFNVFNGRETVFPIPITLIQASIQRMNLIPRPADKAIILTITLFTTGTGRLFNLIKIIN